MIVNGSSNRCVWWWAQHLESDVNEKVRIVDSHGLRPGNIRDMLEQMMDLTQGTNVRNGFYQINMNPAPGEHLSEREWERAREIAEQKHGLEGQPYFMVMHTKHGREHPHFIYSRVDLETGKAISDSHDARKNHAIAREIERELGLEKVIGPYDRDPNAPRPERAPKRWEMYRGMATGIDPRDIAAEVTELFHQSDSGPAFKATLEQHGYELVTGRRGLLILDSAGKEHSLSRRCGITAKELNAFMLDVDRDGLPTLERAQERFQERKVASLQADRDTVRDEINWQEALSKAAIDREKIERRFVAKESKEYEMPRAVGREQAPGNPVEATDSGLGLLAGREDQPAAALGRAGERAVGAAFDMVANAFESLFAAPLTPQQKREAEIEAKQGRAETEHQTDFARHLADLEQQWRRQEEEAHAVRRQRDVDRER
jgi:hypothetical protein